MAIEACRACPRRCGVRREDGAPSAGVCAMPAEPVIARAALHLWEEPCISGKNGSGAVFFSGCSLKCAFCQNFSISHQNFGRPVTKRQFFNILDALIEQGAHTINLVNPTHFAPFLEQALREYHCPVPVVYNTSGYERVETLRRLEGLIDVYLPDLKFMYAQTAEQLAGAADYFLTASKALLEMARQAGEPVWGDDGLLKKGLIVRHLILPGHTEESCRILDWLHTTMPRGTLVSLMAQYTPCGEAARFPELNRRLTRREYDKVVDHMMALGMTDGYLQERSSAKEAYIPPFDLTGVV